MVKNYQLSTLLRGLPDRWCTSARRRRSLLAKGSPLAYLRGKLAFLGILPAALRARRATRVARRIPDRDFVRGGPLTLWPPLTSGRGARTAGRALDATLRFLWSLLGGRS